MRVAREDEGLHAERRVLLDARRHLLGASHERRARTAAHQPHAGPQVGRHLELVAPPTVQRRHPLLAHRVEARESLLRGRDGVVGHIGNKLVGGAPGGFAGLAHDHMQPDTEAQRAAMAGCRGTGLCDLVGYVRRRLAPGEVHVDLLARERNGRIRRAAEPQRGIRLLYRWIKRLRVFHAQVLAREVDRFARRHAPPDAQELVGHFIALGMREEAAIAVLLVWVAASHHVDEQPAIGKTIERRGLPRRDRR
ncbi:hypothetical protein D3C85_1275440 [compost metagenome]